MHRIDWLAGVFAVVGGAAAGMGACTPGTDDCSLYPAEGCPGRMSSQTGSGAMGSTASSSSSSSSAGGTCAGSSLCTMCADCMAMNACSTQAADCKGDGMICWNYFNCVIQCPQDSDFGMCAVGTMGCNGVPVTDPNYENLVDCVCTGCMTLCHELCM